MYQAATVADLRAYAAAAIRLPRGRPFAIIGSPRSGTEVFMELLGSHPGVRADGEVFATPRRLPLAFASGRAALANLRGYSWGFKLIFQHLMWFEPCYGDGPTFLRELHRRGFLFVIVERRNLILQALSYLHAERSSYHFRTAAGSFDRMVVEPAELLAAMHLIEQASRWGHAALGSLPRIELEYEDDLRGPARQARSAAAVFEEIGLPPHEPASSLVRVAPTTIRDRVENYDQVATALRSTKYADLLGEAS